MKALDNYECEGQMSIFDLFNQDTWCGKTSQEPLAQTKEKTSDVCLKKPRKSQTKMPLFLELRGGTGLHQVVFWQMGGALLGEYTMHSFGECPSVEKESRLSQILEVNPHPKYCLSARACQGILNRANRRGKKLPEILEQALIRQATPSKSEGGVEVDSKGKKAGKGALVQTELSGTLGVSQDQTLIETNCLNSWDVQSKHIQPENGKAEALYSGECRYGGGESYVMQSYSSQACGDRDNPSQSVQEEKAFTIPSNPMSDRGQAVVYGISAYDSNSMKSANPHSGIYKADTARTLDLNGGSPACNQGGMAIVYSMGHDIRSAKFTDDEITDPLTATDYKDPIKITAPVSYQEKTGTLNPGAHAGSYNGQDAYNDMLIVEVKHE